MKTKYDRSAAMKAQWAQQRVFFAQHGTPPSPVTPLLEPVAALKQRQPRVISLESLSVSPPETTQELFQRLQRDEVAEMSLRQAGCEDDGPWADVIARIDPPRPPSLLRTFWERMFRPSRAKASATKQSNPWILKEATNDQR